MTPTPTQPEPVDVTIAEIPQLGDVQVIDIRNADEVARASLPCEHTHIPMEALLNRPHLLNQDDAYLLVCAAGIRTQYAAHALRSAGFKKVYSLVGGISALDNA